MPSLPSPMEPDAMTTPLATLAATPASAPPRRSTFLLLGGLYVSQSLGVGFFLIALTAILRERGVGLEQIGLINALGLVWAIKFLWAPLLDRYGSRRLGHYRGWLLLLQPGIAVLLLVMIPFDVVEDLGAVIALVVGVVLLSATQDIAADALAVLMLSGADRGRGNGIQVAGGYLGNIIGGGGVLIVYDAYGWAAALISLAVLTLVPTVLVVRYREDVRADRAISLRTGYAALVTVLRRPGAGRWVFVLMPLTYAGTASAYGLITPALVDGGWSLSRIGLVSNVMGGAVAIGAALLTGVLIARHGARRALLGSLVLALVVTAGVAPLMFGRLDDVGTAAAVSVYFAGYTSVATVVYAVNMALCRTATAGTDFTVLTSIGTIFSVVLIGAVVAAAGTFGYPTMLAFSAVMCLLALAAATLLPVPSVLGPQGEPT